MTIKEDCVDCVNLEFRAESLGFNHEEPKVFVQSQWPVSQKVYVIYRIFVALAFIVWFAADCIYETRTFFKEHTYTYLIYATNWSFLLLTLTALYKATCAIYYSMRSGECLDRQSFDRMPTALKGQWLLQNLSYNSAIVVTASFWSYIGVLENSEKFQDDYLKTVMQTHMSQMKHTLNTVYVIVDVLITATPFRILHLLYTVVLGSVYSLFNAIYFLNDGTIMEGRHYAYNLLDWSKPSESIVTCVLCVVMCIFAQIVLYEIYKIRFSIFTRIYFGPDGKPDSEMQRIMGEMEAPAYQTIDDRGESESGHQHTENEPH
ncbi:protein rolling stone-like isoform X3 [Ruditapes philippinarum]|uniref:protein rolling stone-like isoform X3 n=1 Tax=Ruditapes philippinarum TaxID=129788 RepID=UPI00295BAA19|nr:protein rolling stone-like isoform X3 [Ruditapes philippinarum]